MTVLQNRLALLRFVCREFGYEDPGEMLESLARAPGETGAAGGESEYFRSLYLTPAARVTRDRFAEYDANIGALSRRLRMTGEHGRTWKPHQYLALLFTEHYLRRYFDDPEALRADLNQAKSRHRPTSGLPDYRPDDLRTLAFQSATGSGKTLLMHAHILQYRRHLHRAGGRLNNVVLVTPNEQMSGQHERELRESGLHARVFSSTAGSDLFAPVEIIDLNKLAEKKGVKRVAVRDFGDDNLVLVDEGHLGATGKVWRERRRELSRGGFTFEYSATFNQVATNKDPDLLHAYGKSLLFDYPYRRFHEDGYGKDYAILNLPGGVQDENSDMYLLGCLLTFYQQLRIWRDGAARWREFHPAKPLWVFLGKTVTGSSKADRATRSDVVRILRFLGWVLARGDAVRPMIAHLLAGQSGLLDDEERDFFDGSFSHLPRTGEDTSAPAAEIYADLCEILFHGAGRLHVVYLTAGEGELHLRTADNDPFGVVNVGDSAALYKLLTESRGSGPDPDFDVDREMGFAERLFAGVDRPDSTVNVVIGARRFIAGWNSWRVSTMGLMHVGVGEGPEIIQMFGRGVRLKGWNMSLKRHRESGAPPPEGGDKLAELEKLYIFGLRANYMQTFRDLLQREGVGVERETFHLPTTWNFARKTDLKLIRLKEDRKYELSGERPVLPAPGDPAAVGLPPVTLDLYSRLESVASAGAAAAAAAREESGKGDAVGGNAPAPHGPEGEGYPAGTGFAQPRPGRSVSGQPVSTPANLGADAIPLRGGGSADPGGGVSPTGPGSNATLSRGGKEEAARMEARPDRFGLASHAAFLDAVRLHERLLRRKRQRGWHNLVIERGTVERLLQNDDWYELRLPPERLSPAGFRQLRALEDVALDLVTEYADRFWRRERRRWEQEQMEVVTLDENDPNHVRAWRLSVDTAQDRLVSEARKLADALREGRLDDLKYWYRELKIGVVVPPDAHAYRPLLHVGKDRVVTVQPLPLDENERRVAEGLAQIAYHGDACLQGRELYLIRNLTRGRGVSFFDDFGYYPDFIVWLKDDARQHVLFLDPKGLSRFGGRERRKVALHHEIRKIEDRVRKDDPNLHLHAYVLSVTPADRIEDGLRSAREWRQDGVYFLNEAGCLRQVIEHALEQAA